MFFSLLLALFLPGAFIIFHPLSRKLQCIELIVTVLFLSLSSWICLYTLLKFIPIPLSQLLTVLPVLCLPIFVFLFFHQKPSIQITYSDLIVSLVLLVPLLLFGRITTQQIVPGGSDMATHSYIAKVITYYDGFPDTMEPIVPADHFGFEPVGMPLLIAAATLFTGQPVYTTGLFLSVLTYPLLLACSYIFLRQFFSVVPSMLAAYSVLFTNQHIIGYFTFGAHPTTLSLAFLCTALFWIAAHWKHHLPVSKKSSIILGLLLSASFTVHQIPLITATYFFSPFILVWLFRQRHSQSSRLAVLLCLFVFVLFGASFVSSIQPLSEYTAEYLKEWQQSHGHLSWRGTVWNFFLTVPEYLRRQTGDYWWLLFVPGIILSTTLRGKQRQIFTMFFVALLIYFVIILNSKYWFLPLSQLLYPDRVTTVATLLCVFFTAVTLQVSQQWLTSILHKPQPFTQRILKYASTAVVLIIVSSQFFTIAQHIYTYTLEDSARFSSVTANDHAAIKWIEQHTDQTAVIDNKYSESGVWIPAIAGRRVLHNDASPHSFDALAESVQWLTPTHAYVGEKTVFSSVDDDYHSMLTQQGYSIVFQQGESKVYQR